MRNIRNKDLNILSHYLRNSYKTAGNNVLLSDAKIFEYRNPLWNMIGWRPLESCPLCVEAKLLISGSHLDRRILFKYL